MKQEEQQSGLDYFWRQVSKYLDEYQKDLFIKFYENAKVIEQEKLVGEAKEFAQWIDNNYWICDPFRKEFNDNLLTIDELYELFKKENI